MSMEEVLGEVPRRGFHQYEGLVRSRRGWECKAEQWISQAL